MDDYIVIDQSNWKRAMHCQIFRNSIEPQYCVTLDLDITNFLAAVKRKKYSFTMSFVYAVAKCANDIEEFRYRFLDGKVVLYNKINTSFTYLNKETELFKVVNVDMQDSLDEYVKVATEITQNQKDYFTGAPANNIFQFSSIPWISYKHISHTNSGKRDNATPIFDWGKYYTKDDKVIMPFSIQVHHSFVDAVHIGKLVDSLQKYLNNMI